MKKILVIDDVQHILDIVVYPLEEAGLEVVTALDGESGLQEFCEENPDLVILDLVMPGISGIDVFHKMRGIRPDVPIIMLSSRGDEIDRVLGLELGADDYVTKPFSTRELVARVRTVMRRASRALPSSPKHLLAHGPLKINCDSYAATYDGSPVQLTRSEFRFMECLVRYPARVFTRDVLIDRIHDGEHVVTDRCIDAYVKRLRAKFAAIRPDANPIETVHGLGYKLRHEPENPS